MKCQCQEFSGCHRWPPLSRQNTPMHFLPMSDETEMIEEGLKLFQVLRSLDILLATWVCPMNLCEWCVPLKMFHGT